MGADLIFGLPFSSPQSVAQDIESCFKLGVEHCAFYPLWIYEKTALESRKRSGSVGVPGQSLQEQQFIAGAKVFTSLGYVRYTAFHYCSDEAAQHRYGLWQMHARDWVGFGMSAMSHLDGVLYFNDRSVRGYIDRITAGVSACVESRDLSVQEQMTFALLYGLRLEKYRTSAFADRFHIPAETVFATQLGTLQKRGLLQIGSGTIALTPQGILQLGAVEDHIRTVLPADAREDRHVSSEVRTLVTLESTDSNRKDGLSSSS